MPKNEHSTLATIARPSSRKRSDPVTEILADTERRLHKKSDFSLGIGHRKGPKPDRTQPSDDTEVRQRKAREMAVVSLGPEELLALSQQPETETTFTEDDARACPRDLEAFRLAVSIEIDRLRANKKNY